MLQVHTKFSVKIDVPDYRVQRVSLNAINNSNSIIFLRFDEVIAYKPDHSIESHLDT